MAHTVTTSSGDLEQALARLAEQKTFPHPPEFREQALIRDESVYEQAEADFEGFWAEQAEALHWERKWDQVLDGSNPPFYEWFTGGRLNVAYNCVDRHVMKQLQGKVAERQNEGDA